MYNNAFFDRWTINLSMTNTLDLVHRLFYKLDKNISLLFKLSETQKILIDDYQLITMNQFKNDFIIDNNKITPVPKYNGKFDGEYFTYFEIKNKLPSESNVGTINNKSLNQFLININKCNANIIEGKNKILYDNVLLKTYINNNDNCVKDLQFLKDIINDYHKALKSLSKGGNLYVNLGYYNYEPNIIFLQYILSFFESIEYIHNPVMANKIGYNMIKFNNYNGTKTTELKTILDEYKSKDTNEKTTMINNFYCNKHDINESVIKTLFDNKLDENFIAFLNGIYKQQNEHMKTSIKKIKYIDYKNIPRHINNQVDRAINYCDKYNIEVNDIYKESEIEVKPYIIKKYFKYEKGVDLSKIKMTNDAIYSVSSVMVAEDMSRLIKRAFPHAKSIIDGTANVGGNTLNFSLYFDKVTSIEISKKTFEVLKNNVNVYKRKNVELIHGDFINLMDSMVADVIFMDPPWTGTFYRMFDNMDLFLSDINIIDIIPKLKCKMVALKLPSNYNVKGLLDKVNRIELFKIHGVLFILIRK